MNSETISYVILSYSQCFLKILCLPRLIGSLSLTFAFLHFHSLIKTCSKGKTPKSFSEAQMSNNTWKNLFTASGRILIITRKKKFGSKIIKLKLQEHLLQGLALCNYKVWKVPIHNVNWELKMQLQYKESVKTCSETFAL